MNNPPDRPRKHRLKLTLAAALALLILGWLSWDTYRDYRYAEAQLPAIVRMEIVRAEIIHLDEVLTMSARMAAASGNPEWETRYRRFEPQLDQSIKEALRLDPEASQGAAAAKTDAANVALVAMEHRAFELVRQGKHAEAQRLLSSGEYGAQKKIYAAGMTEFTQHLMQAGDSVHMKLLADLRRNAITTIVSAMLLILGSLFVFLVTHRWQTVIVESNRKLNQKTAELESLNNQLDDKVMERTRELNESALASLNMMEDAVQARVGLESVNEQLRSEITERKAAEARIVFLNRVYVVLSGINTLIVRVNDRDELFREACRVAVEIGGFRMAMIAIQDRGSMKIVPVASAGKDEGLLAAIKGLLSSSEDAPKTMTARAIREKTAVVSNDTLNDPRVLLGKQYAESGVHSLAILPLIVANEAVGVITLYASEIEFFHEEELNLLTELAGDIAYAVDHIGKQERLNYLAYYDVLTGLANRTLFLERVAQYMRSADSGGHKLAIGLIDLERFKSINDSLGRPAGDALLRQVAEWLTQFARDASLLARIDADHFAFVVPEVKSDGNLILLFDNVAKAFPAHLFRVNNTELRLTAKTGIALFPDDGTDAETLFKHAEAALKTAKKSGDRYLFYAKKMTEAVAGKLTLENQLRQAIDKGEFVLHYQPKVNLASGKVTSAEALIRWNDPRTGMVPPGKFIPILEETGLIHEVGRWALHKAIEDYLRWRAAGLPAVRIAVNVSPLQLHNPGFIAEIEQVIAIDTHVAAGLELEITESLIMDDVERNITTLNAIRAMGITIAIDDFGTGFSSLNYLAKLPVDTLKIDRSFVIEMNFPEGLALVSTIIIVAHALKLKTVAEGVETEEQSRQLLSLNCDEMQGYLFSKPVPVEIFETRFLAAPTLKI